jgi:hypothetical protein
VRVKLVVAVVALAACHVAGPRPPTTGTLAGLARDRDSGEPIALAELHVRAVGDLATSRAATTSDRGGYAFDLAPGTYSLAATFAGQPIHIENIAVRAGEISIVDVTFTLGRPDAVVLDWNDPKAGAIDRYRPRNLAPTAARIEGTISDMSTRVAVGGAVVTAIGPGSGPEAPTQQTVSDDRGRYRFDTVTPGTYIVSAYYGIGGRGQIEMRRSEIRVAGAEAVVVPLWVEVAKQ